jgi:ribosomal protein L17
MYETLSYGEKTMSRTKELYETVENLVYEAIEQGANNTSNIYSYVSQFVPQSLISYNLIEQIVTEYSAVDYETDNVY